MLSMISSHSPKAVSMAGEEAGVVSDKAEARAARRIIASVRVGGPVGMYTSESKHQVSMRRSRRLGVLALLAVINLPASAQSRDTEWEVAPTSGLVLAVDDEGVVAASALGLGVGVPVSSRWAVSTAYRTFDPGADRSRVHSASFSLQWQVGGPFRLGVEAGALGAGTLRNDGRVSYGPRIGMSASIPLGQRWSLAVSSSAAGLFPDAGFDGAEGGLPVDVVSEVAAGLRFHPFRASCVVPTSWTTVVPSELLPYEAGGFQVEVPRGVAAEVLWNFGDGLEMSGAAVERLFVKEETYSYRAVITHCAGVDTVQGVVHVQPQCLEAPAVEGIVQVPATAAIGEPFALTATLSGTPPFDVQWRWADQADTTTTRTDSTATLRFPVGLPGPARVDLEVDNCTNQPVEAPTVANVRPGPPSAVVVTFGFDSCSFDPGPPMIPVGNSFLTEDGHLDPGHVESLLRYLNESEDHWLVIDGYADKFDANYNDDLSGWRAETVRRYLATQFRMRRGANADRLLRRVLVAARGFEQEPDCDPRETICGCLAQRRAVIRPTTVDQARLVTPWTPTAARDGLISGQALPAGHCCLSACRAVGVEAECAVARPPLLLIPGLSAGGQ